jgi:DNA modification methylase
MKDLESIANTIVNGDCIEVMKTLPEGSIDLVVTSCPYNVGIDYDMHNDRMTMEEYWDFTKQWLTEVFRVLKDDGRIALNIPYEVNIKDRGGRVFMVAEVWKIMEEIGFKWFGLIDLDEQSPHRSKTTAWGCYDKETKVMTDKGLKLFKDVDIKNDLFVTLNVDTKNVEYQQAFNYIEKPYKGKLVSIKHRGVDLLITDNHNMIISENGNNHIKPYNEIASNSFSIPRQHNGVCDSQYVDKITIPSVTYGLRTKKEYRNNPPIDIEMNDWLKFLGIFLTDGSFTYDEKRGIYKVSIYQKKENFLNEIEDLLDRLPFNFEYKNSKFEYYTCSKQLASFLVETKNKNFRTIPDYVFDCSKEQKEILLKWLFYGDGSFNKQNELWKISVCSKTMVNQIGRLLIETGRMFSLYEYQEKKREYNGRLMKSNHPMTTIQIITKENSFITKEHISSVDYDDNVYCVSVPNKTLLVEKSGQLVWCGNSWMSPSAPYIYNPKECVIIAYKKYSKKQFKGTPQWEGEYQMVPNEKIEGEFRKKLVYDEKDKKDFISLVYGQWNYFADTQQKTKATFSLDIPYRAIKILSYKEDIVMDPFNGSGTTCLAAEMLGRKWIGVDISPNYCEVARNRIHTYQLEQEQLQIVIDEVKKD